MKINKYRIKGDTGFTCAWFILCIYSAVMSFYDLKVSILGIMVLIMFGFLGFDMFSDLIKQINKGFTKRGKK